MHHQVPHNNGITPVMQAPIPLTQGVNVDVSPLTQIVETLFKENSYFHALEFFKTKSYNQSVQTMKKF